MKTTITRQEDVKRSWYLVDARDQVLGRMAVQIANILRGRNRPDYTPHVDGGDFVVVINADKVVLTGRKEDQKTYARFSGYRGGLKVQTARQVRARHPDRLVTFAVRGMLPRNTTSRRIITRLKVYAGDTHPHAAQNPQPIQPVKGKGAQRG